MSTTRHLINRQRRRQAVGNQPVPAARATDDAQRQEAPESAGGPGWTARTGAERSTSPPS